MLTLPSYSIQGWFFSPRIEKTTHFEINGKPFDQESWSSRWGQNRPVDERPHAILSEIEVRVKHQSRSSLVEVTVIGDSSSEVDAFINTLKSDVTRTYTTGDQLGPRHALAHGEYKSTTARFWRQSYLWVLMANCIVFFVLWFSIRSNKDPAK